MNYRSISPARPAKFLFLVVSLMMVWLTACTPLRPLDSPFSEIEGSHAVNLRGRMYREFTNLPLGLEESVSVGMAGFELGFGEGNDHQISEIGVEVRSEVPPGEIRFAFNEDDNDDYFLPFYAFQLLDSISARSLEASADCLGACEVSIARPDPNEIFVLRGFNFRRYRGRSNLRKFSITPDPVRGTVHVEFADNGALDYQVSLQYAYVDGGSVEGEFHSDGSRRSDTDAREILLSRMPGSTLLQGFSFEFLNSDHRIGEISISPDSADSLYSYRVRFNDQNTDDPYQVSVDYLILRP